MIMLSTIYDVAAVVLYVVVAVDGFDDDDNDDDDDDEDDDDDDFIVIINVVFVVIFMLVVVVVVNVAYQCLFVPECSPSGSGHIQLCSSQQAESYQGLIGSDSSSTLQ